MKSRPLRPFPLPLNVGTDICQISRIYGILASPRRARFVNRILAPEEVARHKGRLNWDDGKAVTAVRDGELWKTAAFIAGRFAAKEAAIKAHSFRNLTFHDILIERREGMGERLGGGPPVARIRSECSGGEDASALISISHDGDYATAVCIAHEDGSSSE